MIISVDFWGAGGLCPVGSDTEEGEICLAPSVFWRVIPTWQQEIRNSGRRFGLHLNSGAKLRAEIELLSLTKLCKNISLPRNLVNQQKIDA